MEKRAAESRRCGCSAVPEESEADVARFMGESLIGVVYLVK